MTRTYLTFFLLGELYAMQVDKVLEVLEKQDLTVVPNAPLVIQGVLSFRGNVVPIYETRILFNLSKSEQESDYFVVIIETSTGTGTCQVGAIVDKVKEVIKIDDTDIKPVPVMNKEFKAELLKGIVKLNDQFMMIIDVDKIFDKAEIKMI